MSVVQLGCLNVYSPSDEQVLQLAKATTVRWMGRGEGKFFKKASMSGPHPGQGTIVYYSISLAEEVKAPFPIIPVIN